MTFSELARFIQSEMRMSQVYQPVFLGLLFDSETGVISKAQAADAFRQVLDADPDKTFDVHRYPGDVLIDRGILERFGGQMYRLLGFEDLALHERQALTELCDARLELYLSGSELADAVLGPGRVYILTSQATPTLFKVGYTTTRAEYRAREISRGTGVPAAFNVLRVYSFARRVSDRTDDPEGLRLIPAKPKKGVP